jgi:hypothetical protein
MHQQIVRQDALPSSLVPIRFLLLKAFVLFGGEYPRAFFALHAVC